MKQKYDSIIFDMDGVLIDVSRSYREAIRKTVVYVLDQKYGKKVSIPSSDINEMKSIPGFNNDWDLSFALIQLKAKGFDRKKFRKEVKAVTTTVRNSKAYQNVKDIFQAYYLGNNIYFQTYKRKAPVNVTEGLIKNESLLLDVLILAQLSKNYRLGVATSRPRFEALFALKNLRVTPAFIPENCIVAQEDTPKEKPAPDPLLEAKKRLKSDYPIYVGDSINDAVAAQKANVPCVFVGTQQLGDIQIRKTNDLKEVFYG